MKWSLAIIIAVVLSACGVRTFNYRNDRQIPTTGTTTINLDESFVLYRRAICRYRGTNADEYNDCRKIGIEKKTQVEIEYLLLSEKQNKAVYISNHPDKFASIYSREVYQEPTYVNTYFISQIHFGQLNKANKSIVFNGYDGVTVKWNYSLNTGIFKIESIDENGNPYNLAEALALIPEFEKQPSFEIVFSVSTQKELVMGNKEIVVEDITPKERKVFFKFLSILPDRRSEKNIEYNNRHLISRP